MYNMGVLPIYGIKGGELEEIGSIGQWYISEAERVAHPLDNLGLIHLSDSLGKLNLFMILPTDTIAEDGVYLFFDGVDPIMQRVKALVGGDFAVIGDKEVPKIMDADPDNWKILGRITARTVDIEDA